LLTPRTTVIVAGVKEKLLMDTLTVVWAVATCEDEIARNNRGMNPNTRAEKILLLASGFWLDRVLSIMD